MGKKIALKIRGMKKSAKMALTLLLTFGVTILMFEGWLRPLIISSATNTYYFTLDSTPQNLGYDGSTNTTATLDGRISMGPGVFTASKLHVTAASTTNWQQMLNVYGPVYTSGQTFSAPQITIGIRDNNGTSYPIYWKADVYEYDPAGNPGTQQLLWSTTGTDEAHQYAVAAKALTFSNPAAKTMGANRRLKIIISCRMTSTNSSARLYWGGDGNYSFMTVTEAATAPNTVTVTNLVDYNGGGLASVLTGEQNVAMLRFDLYANAATTWSGGRLDKIGTNVNLGDVTYAIHRDANNNGLFDAGTDTLVGGPYAFSQATGSSYTLSVPQTLSLSPQRYFITYSISTTAASGTRIGARIADSSYFTITNGLTVANVSATSSSLPVVNGTGIPVTKTYPADWDSGTTLVAPETGGPVVTNSPCVTTSQTYPPGATLVGLFNYPSHTCIGAYGSYHVSMDNANPRFVTLYFNGSSGYPTNLAQVKGISFKFAARYSGNLTLFYTKPDGTRVTSPVSTPYASANNSVNGNIMTVSLAGQNFTNVPAGSRLGLQIGTTRSGSAIGLGGAVGAELIVEETASATTGVDVGDGVPIANGTALAGSVDNVVDSFTLASPSGNKTVTSLTITGNATTNGTNIATVKVYADGGIFGVLDPGDRAALIGSASFSGNSATITGLSLDIGATMKRFLVTYDITATPTVTKTLTGLVSAVGGVTVDSNNDVSSATLTITPSTIISNGISEPLNAVIPAGGPITNLDAFGISTNGGVGDTINTLTVTLAPAGISARVAKLDIVDRTTGTLYGELTAPTSGDDWRISTTSLVATAAVKECFVRIIPKADITLTYTIISGLVTGATHLQSANGLLLHDTTSASIILDGQDPTNPVLTASSGPSSGSIRLDWTSAFDAGGLHHTIPYKVVRGGVNAPAPANCSTGVAVYEGSALSYVESSLSPGQIYAYRVCARDVVNNVSAGTRASGTATIPTSCNKAPSIVVNPLSKSVSDGGNAAYTVSVTNNDTGACAPAVFSLSVTGTENSADFVTPSTISPATLTLGPNGGGAAARLTVTSRTGAPQGATDTLVVRVTAAGHPAANAQAIETVVSNAAPLLHTSLNSGTKKYGVWGTDHTCSTCHTRDKTSNIKKVAISVATPTGSRPVVFSKVSTAAAVTVGVLGNDRREGPGSKNICEVCHHKTRFHQYSTAKTAVRDHHNSSDCMKCHPHKTGFKYSGGALCSDCHGNPPVSFASMVFPSTNALGPFAPNAGAHEKHNRDMGCGTCHSNANHGYGTSPVGNNLIEMGFVINNQNFPGFNGSLSTGTLFTATDSLNSQYLWAAAPGTTLLRVSEFTTTCSVYCHGWPGGGGINPTPSWVGASQRSCGTCHDSTGEIPPSSGSHTKHSSTGIGGNAIPCSRCHSTYANYSTSVAHVNGNVEWNLSLVSPNAAYKGSNSGSTGAKAPTDPANYGHCTNIYCHSNVQGATNAAQGTGGPYFYATPKWNEVATCGSCHKNMYSDIGATGGHPQHAQNPDTSFDCRICHSTGGTTNPRRHADGTIDLDFNGTAVNTIYSKGGSSIPGTGYGNCSNSDCHGRDTVFWGPPNNAIPNLCDKCHGSQDTSGFYSTSGPGTTIAKTDRYVGAHDQHVRSVPYTYTSPGDCSHCHIKAAGPYSPGHIDSPLPAEMVFGPLASAGTFYGYTSLPAYNSNNGQCSNVWCHGAGLDSNRGAGVYARVIADGGLLGTANNPVWNVPFLNGSANDCGRCHGYPPSAPNSGYTHFNKGPTDCITCHNNVNQSGTGFTNPSIHVDGYIDGGCITCHGNPPVDTAGLVIPSVGALSPGNAGSHNAHQLNPSIGNDCAVCHNNYTFTMPSYTMEMGFKAYGGKVVSGTFWGYSTLNDNVYVSSSPGTSVRRTNNVVLQNRCDNVYCHGGGTSTLAPLGGGTNIRPYWELGYDQVACGTCHGVSATSIPTAGSHTKHASDTGLALGCGLCHGEKVNNYHVNGSVEWQMKLSDQRIGPLARYKNISSGATGNLGPSASFGSCNGVYCHSNGQSNNAAEPIYRQPIWGASLTNGCGNCHNNMKTFSNTTSGSHKAHAQAANYDCALCHNGYTASSANGVTHINRKIDMAAGITYSKYSAAGFAPAKGSFGRCSSGNCHGAGRPLWGANTAAAECHKCHGSKTAPFASVSSAQVAPGYGSDGQDTGGNTAATAPRVGTHQAHLLASTGLTKPVLCSDCHVKVATVTAASHLNFTTATVTFSGRAITASHSPRATRSNGVVTCTNTYCHTGKLNSGASMVPAWNDTGYLPGSLSVAGCGKCHGLPPTPGSGAHSTVPATISSFPTTSCGCHENLNSGGSGYGNIFIDNNKHLNGTIEASGGHSFPYPGTSHRAAAGTTPWSSCTGCHANAAGGTYPVASGTAPNCTGCHINTLRAPTGTSSCWDCHGVSSTNGMPNGGVAFPNWSGSHRTHVVGRAMACSACHDGGGTGSTSHGYSNGVAKTRTTVVVSSPTGAFSYAAASRTCSSLACHGNAVWSVTQIDCVSCHSVEVTIAAPGAGSLVGQKRRAVATEFTMTWSHKRSGGRSASKADCIVCHMEGNPATGGTSSVHMNGVIELRDPDTGSTIEGVSFTGTGAGGYSSTGTPVSFNRFGRNLANSSIESVVAAIQINHCLKCHDSNGAMSTTARVPSVGTAVKPFGTTVASTVSYYLYNQAAGNTSGGVVDVSSAFNVTNASYHPVKGKQNNPYIKNARLKAPWNTLSPDKTGTNTTSWGKLISCWDCHAPSGTASTVTLTSTVTAHGGASVIRGTWSTSSSSTLCLLCHTDNYGTSGASNHGTGSAFGSSGDSSRYTMAYCGSCHGSTINARAQRGQDSHGFNRWAQARTDTVTPANSLTSGPNVATGHRPYGFIRSNNMGHVNPASVVEAWTPSGNKPGCVRSSSPCSNSHGTYGPGGTY